MQLRLNQPLPALAAEFETVVYQTQTDGIIQQSHHRWRLWRDLGYIETHNLDDDSGEVWCKTETGEIGYQRLFHSQQQLIDYLPGDLKALQETPNWTALSSLLNPAMVEGLHGGEAVEIADLPALRYQSLDQTLQVWWLTQQQLPGLIDIRQPNQRILTRIQAVYALPQAPWPYRRARHYTSTDFADLGDRESDTFIQSILPRLKGSHHH